jgi:hypothetical protein
MTRPRRKRRILAGICASLFLTAIGLEVGCRLVDRWRGKPWSAEASQLAIGRIITMLTRISYEPGIVRPPDETLRLARASILNPYTGWEEKLTQKRISEDTAYYGTSEAKAACDIVVLGGSVAYFFCEQGGPPLAERLRDTPPFRGREFRFHNYALGGFKQPQPALTLAALLAYGHEPDIVLEMDGFNEAAIGWANGKSGMHPAYPSMPHWTSATNGMGTRPEMVERLYAVRSSQDRAREYAEGYLRSGVWRSCFLDHVASFGLARRQRAYVAAYDALMQSLQTSFKDELLAGPAFDTSDDGIARAIVEAWEEGSITMRGLCAQRKIPYLHVLQPTLHDEGSKTLTAKEQDNSRADPNWIAGVHRVYPDLRTAGARLAERGVDFVDGSRAFAGDTGDLYYDPCHFAARGNRILAAAVVEPLLRACARD